MIIIPILLAYITLTLIMAAWIRITDTVKVTFPEGFDMKVGYYVEYGILLHGRVIEVFDTYAYTKIPLLWCLYKAVIFPVMDVEFEGKVS